MSLVAEGAGESSRIREEPSALGLSLDNGEESNAQFGLGLSLGGSSSAPSNGDIASSSSLPNLAPQTKSALPGPSECASQVGRLSVFIL